MGFISNLFSSIFGGRSAAPQAALPPAPPPVAPPPATPPTPASPIGADVADQSRRRSAAAAGMGFGDTLATGPQGQNPAGIPVAGKTLLGS